MSRRSTTASSSAGVEEVRGDIRSERDVRALVDGADVLVHAAAALPIQSSRAAIRSVNVEGTANVLAGALTAGVRRVVLISSTAVYGVPERHPIVEDDPLVGVGWYGESKIEAEQLAGEFGRRGLDVVIIRPKTFIGPERLGVFEILFDWIRDGRRIPILGDGGNLYQLLAVEDLVDAVARSFTAPVGGMAVNVGAGVVRHRSRRPAGADRPRRLRLAAVPRPRHAGRALAARARARAALAARRVALQDRAQGLVRLDRACPRAARLGAAALECRDALRHLRLVPRAPRRHARGRHDAPRAVEPAGARRAQEDRLISPAMRELLDYRSEFPILEHTTYLINHSLAAMPAKAEERLAEYARMWKERGIRSWGEGWWTMPMTVGDQIGRIIGGAPGTTVMHQNVAVAEAVVLSSFFPIDPARNRVVYEQGNFPSVRYLYQAQPDLEVVVCEDDGAIVDAIDERTLLVPISHVLFKTGEIQEIEPIIRRAHEVGAYVILDCYQSAGIVPFDVTALNVDFAVGGSVKWLCGGPGNGWLYVRPDLAERLQPTYTGWQAHERPFGFEEEMEYAEGAARFLTGTPNVPALYAATAGYDLIEEVGVDRIRENSLRQTQLLIDLADEAGFEVRSPRSPERQGRHGHRPRARVRRRAP